MPCSPRPRLGLVSSSAASSLRCARSAEDVALGFDEDVSVPTSPGGVAVVTHAQSVLRQERADRAAAPMLVGLEGTSAAAAVGWLVVALGRRGE